MRRYLVGLAVLAGILITISPAAAGDPLNSRWRGGWVVLATEATSDCAGRYTNNRVYGHRVDGNGATRFAPGELGQIHKVDVHKQKIDVYVDIETPLLRSYGDGPFTLYRTVTCKAELIFEVPRHIVKAKDIDALEKQLHDVLEVYNTRDEATLSARFNQRETDPYPDDYEHTLRAHARWKAEQHNEVVQAKLDDAHEVAYDVIDRIDDDPEYGAGFVEGVEAMREKKLGNCDRIVRTTFDGSKIRPSGTRSEEWVEGWYEGQSLAYHMEMLDELPECFVPLPDVDDTLVANGLMDD